MAGNPGKKKKVDPHSVHTDTTARGSAPPPPPAPPAKKTGSKAYEWEAALADAMKIPYTQDVKKFFDAWHSMEHSAASNNPFNISVDRTGKAIGTFQSSGPGATHIQNYATPTDGILGTAAFILTYDRSVANALRAGDFHAAAMNLDAGHWAPQDKAYGSKIFAAFQAGTYTIGNNAPVNLSPKAKAQIAAQAATIRAQTEAASQSYIQATTDLAASKELAKQTAHISDPWVTLVKDKNGIARFGIATGYTAPNNALTYQGSPLTKSELSSVWGARYADTYEAYTGKTATPGVIAQILDGGYSMYGLQAALTGGKLQSWNQFKNSPIYKQKVDTYQSSAQNLLGKKAPSALIKKAFADSWDQTAFEQNLRTYTAPDGSRPWLQGPEFMNRYGAMKTTYQKIYGATDQTSEQSIKEAAASGWDENAFGTYLRSQPQYTTSLEYQSNAVNFLDSMGLLLKMAPVMKPVKQSALPTGGTAVPNSPLVPGAPKPLGPALTVGAGLQPVGSGS